MWADDLLGVYFGQLPEASRRPCAMPGCEGTIARWLVIKLSDAEPSHIKERAFMCGACLSVFLVAKAFDVV